MPTLNALLRGAGIEKDEIDWIAVSCGPGSYTGIRVGVTTAKTLAHALGVKLVLVPTLQVLAQNATYKRAYILIDARRKKIYAQLFERDAEKLMRPAWPERVVSPEEAMEIVEAIKALGYSADTDILLTTRVLKGREGEVRERIFGACKTGLTMSLTTLGAILPVIFISSSKTLVTIGTVLFLGIVCDIINTWLGNAVMLRWWVEKNGKG